MITRTIQELRARLATREAIGLVPTMGALHEGHLSLIGRAREDCRTVVVSIFVNPIQFNQQEDYALYPRTLEEDALVCREAGVDLIFAPTEQEMYPAAMSTFVEVPSVSERLCGYYRPGHFKGVATVVMKLLQIVGSERAYFGQKDVQQLAVIRRMVRDLNVPVEIVPVATVREPDGLAMSSRNQRLTAEERRIAPMLYQALKIAAREGAEEARRFLAYEPRIRLEYLEIVDPLEMQPTTGSPAVIAIAAWIGSVRLIDNFQL